MASVLPLDAVRAQGSSGLDLLLFEVDKLVSLPDIYYRLEEIIVKPASAGNNIAEAERAGT